jgi:hypothetical protein
MSTTQPQRKKLIEVALPLEATNQASAREKSIRHGHPPAKVSDSNFALCLSVWIKFLIGNLNDRR